MYYTMSNILYILSILIICIFVIYFFIISRLKRDKFYNKSIYPMLNTINNYDIINEVKNNLNNNWMDWPETHLYQDFKINGNWKIIPFFGFNTGCHSNCNQFPQITQFLQNIKSLRYFIYNPHKIFWLYAVKKFTCPLFKLSVPL